MSRLFFGLAPDAAARSQLAQLAGELALEASARPTAEANLHLTLAFLGEQPSTMLPALTSAAGRVHAGAFDLALDRIDVWRKSGIVWAGPRAMSPGLRGLQEALASALLALGVTLEERAFSPHVTLGRKPRSALARALSPAIVWRVEAFSLFVSEPGRDGVVYRALASWPLA